MEYRPLETELGILKGRDAIYLDDVQFDYQNRKLFVKGEINGNLCSKRKDGWIRYELIFKSVLYYTSCELDIWTGHEDSSILHTSSYGEFVDSALVKTIQHTNGERLRHILIQTYDDVLEVACKNVYLTLLH